MVLYVKQNPYTVSLDVHGLFYYSLSSRTNRESSTQVYTALNEGQERQDEGQFHIHLSETKKNTLGSVTNNYTSYIHRCLLPSIEYFQAPRLFQHNFIKSAVRVYTMLTLCSSSYGK